jgi:hypothetical protein
MAVPPVPAPVDWFADEAEAFHRRERWRQGVRVTSEIAVDLETGSDDFSE